MEYYDLTKADHAEILAMQIASVLRTTDMTLLDLIKDSRFTILHPRSYYYSGVSWAIPADNDNSRFALIVGMGANPCEHKGVVEAPCTHNYPHRRILSCLAAVRGFFGRIK